MGFNSVYRALQELFPTVDARLLKAVAIEHPKDADAAAEVVLNDILPYTSKWSQDQGSSSIDTGSCSSLDTSGEHENLQLHRRSKKIDADTSFDPKLVASDTMTGGIVQHAVSKSLVESGCSSSSFHSATVGNDLQTKGNEELTESRKATELCEKASLDQDSSLHSDTNDALGQRGSSTGCQELNSVADCQEEGTEVGLEQSNLISTSINMINGIGGACCHGTGDTVDDLKIDYPEEEVHCGDSGFNKSLKRQDNSGEMVVSEEDSPLESTVTQSVKFCSPDVLEEVIEDAKNYKKTLFSSMESVISMMREVEFHEKAAEEAKAEVAEGGFDILYQEEELKRTLERAKEANDMHSGEVYGEKAILATELRELQSRLFNLSCERDKSLAMLDEMHQSLEARLSTAEEAKKAAEKEKLEKEESAKKALAEQEAIMEEVVQESKLIQQQADENTKLREFLVDRGHLVDALQGEISVICQDVRLLKEKFDQRVPLSASVSSSQTTCLLASSSSSVRSKASDQVCEQSEEFKMVLKESSASSADGQLVGEQGEVSEFHNFPDPLSMIDSQSTENKLAEENTRVGQRMLVDDGWEICNV